MIHAVNAFIQPSVIYCTLYTVIFECSSFVILNFLLNEEDLGNQLLDIIMFNRGAEVSDAARTIYAVYGENVIGESTPQKWFSPFKRAILK